MIVEKNEIYNNFYFRLKITIPSNTWEEIKRRGDVSRIDSIVTDLLNKYYI